MTLPEALEKFDLGGAWAMVTVVGWVVPLYEAYCA